jgi:hypothetical protein
VRIINDLSRFKQQSYRPLRPHPPLLKKFLILIIEICLVSGR